MSEFGKWNGKELEYLKIALDSENKHDSFVHRFEKAFSDKFGVKYSIAMNSGTSTLHSCLFALGVGPGDEVISPAQTVIMPTFAIVNLGATPVYADIDRDTFNIKPNDIERKITNKTKAIIAVHMHGLPSDMKNIMKISKKYKVPVIEDSAQCMLGAIDGKLAGTFGAFGSFSFENKKHVSTGEGGMVITNNEELGTKARKFAGLGYKSLSAGMNLSRDVPRTFQNPFYKRHDTLGLNYRMTEFTAAIGLAQFERVEELVERRKVCAKKFLDVIKDFRILIPQKVPDGYTHTYWTLTAKYDGDDWFEFYDLFNKNGGDGFYGGLSVTYEEPIAKKICYKGKCPIAEEIQPKLVQFKTGYRDLRIADHQASVLRKTLEEIS